MSELSREDLDALLDLTACPADRLWRYPLSRAMVPFAMRLPLRPNHVTVFHTALAVAAGVVLSAGTTRAMVAAGLMFEARAILDCLDGAGDDGSSHPLVQTPAPRTGWKGNS